jgi:hypothetical protein
VDHFFDPTLNSRYMLCKLAQAQTIAYLASRCLRKFRQLGGERTIKRIAFSTRIPVPERGLTAVKSRSSSWPLKRAATHQSGGWKHALDANFFGGDHPICGARLCGFPLNLRS